jgi:hypothetical protein
MYSLVIVEAYYQVLFFGLFTVATLVVALRIIIRLQYGLRRLFAEDYLVIAAWVCLDPQRKLTLLVVLALAIQSGLVASSQGNPSLENSVDLLKVCTLHSQISW